VIRKHCIKEERKPVLYWKKPLSLYGVWQVDL